MGTSRSTAPRVVVIGAGVSGLSCAVRLAEAGHAVEVWSDREPLATTSAVAPAFWYPWRAGGPDVLRWAARTFAVFAELAARDPACGVRFREGVELLPGPMPDPPWRDLVRGFRRLEPTAGSGAGGGAGAAGAGFAFTTPIIATDHYLPWLQRRAEALGVTFVQRRVRAFDEAFARAPVVVHCAGIGARELAADPTLQPVRGQVVRVAAPAVRRFVLDDFGTDGIAYVVPRLDDCVLGGTWEEVTDAAEPIPDVATGAAIVARCQRLVPELLDAPIVSQAAGLRPVRPEVRLEAEAHARGLLVHDYGHGGAGVTMSWGCAERVVELVREHS